MPSLPTTSEQPEPAVITWRPIIIGFVILLIFLPFVCYSYTVTQSTDLASDHSTIAAVFFLVLLVLIINVIWIRVLRGRGLNRAELLVVYIMLIMPSAVATLGVCESLMPILVAPVYQKSAGNRFETVVMKHLSHEIIITDKQAAKEFMERLPMDEGESIRSWLGRIRWGAFVPPVARWLIFLVALQFTVICLATIFRRQWVERELLPFPLARLPIMLTEHTDRSSVLPDLFRNKMFYLGALLPIVITSLRAIHYYYPNFPAPVDQKWSPKILEFGFTAKFNYVMFGFAYLVSLSSLKGLWLWALLFIVFQAICFRFGVKFPENLGPFGVSGNALIYHAGMGAIIVFALYSIWVARKHLRDVFAKALGMDESIDDAQELMTYRLAVFGFGVGMAVMLLWLVRYGVPFHAALAFMAVVMAVYLTMSRIVAEVGLAECLPTGVPGAFTISKLGPHSIGYGGVMGMGPHLAWVGDLRTFTMAAATNGLRISGEFSSTRIKLFVGFFGSVVLGLVVSLLSTYLIGNATGKINTGPTHHATSLPKNVYNFSMEVLKYGEKPWAAYRKFSGAEKGTGVLPPTPSTPVPAVPAQKGAPGTSAQDSRPPGAAKDEPDPETVRLVSPSPAAAVAIDTAAFEWEPIEGTDRYLVEISDAKTKRLVARGYTTECRYTYGEKLEDMKDAPKALKVGKTYRWRIRAESLAGPNKFGWWATLGGMAMTAILMFLQRRVLWWPLPATGFVIGGAWLMQHVWFAVFVAWLVKATVLRYGGASAYRKSLPFFMGLIAGELCTHGTWAIIDLITGKHGNKLFAF